MNLFDESLQYTLNYNCVVEGTLFQKDIERQHKISDESIQKSRGYKHVVKYLTSISDEEFGEVKQNITRAKELLKESESEYLNKSIVRQIIESIPAGMRDKIVISMEKDKFIPESKMKHGANIVFLTGKLRCIELALSDAKYLRTKKGCKYGYI